MSGIHRLSVSSVMAQPGPFPEENISSIGALFTWIQWQRSILVRWEYGAANFAGFIQLAAINILLEKF